MPWDLSSEDELCLLLVRAQLTPEARERASKLLAGPLEWPRFSERARRYGIFPLLYSSLQTLGFPGMPEPVRSEWTKIFGLNALRNELLSKELARILRLLCERGIRVMPLKGVALGETLYGDPALRPTADIDVLVPQRQAIEAFHLLVASGYESDLTKPRLLDLAVRYGKHCTLTRHEALRDYSLELHCGLFWGGQLERGALEALWSEARPQCFYGIPAFALSPEWELLYLAAHAAQHARLALTWYVDLDRICRRGVLDWKSASEKARWLGWEEAVRSSLAVCQSLFDTPVDPAFGAGPPPPASRLTHRRGEDYSQAASGAERLGEWKLPISDLQIPSENLFLFRLLKTPSRKLRYLAIRILLPTPAECALIPLPDSLFFLYYPLRPLRVACNAARWVMQAGWKRVRRTMQVG